MTIRDPVSLRSLVAGSVLLLAAFLAAPSRLVGQDGVHTRTPFGSGESLAYDVKLGFLFVGTGRMEVAGIDTVRGRMAWHTRLEIEGGIPGFRVRYHLQSWIDTQSFASLRFISESTERSARRRDEVEIYPERGVYQETKRVYEEASRTWTTERGGEEPTSEGPLDQASFLFFTRTLELPTGARMSFDRYFKPDRNPVLVSVLRRELTRVSAGTFPTIVIRPVFRARGLFSQSGRTEIWLSDDDRRLMVRMETALPFGTVSLQLREFQPGLRSQP